MLGDIRSLERQNRKVAIRINRETKDGEKRISSCEI